MDTQEKPQKKFYKKWWFWVLVIIFTPVVIGAFSGASSPAKSVPATADNAPANAPAQQAAAPQTLLDLKGSGSKTTAKFTAAGDWDLNWSYDCSNFGNQGNFQVMVYTGDGSLSFENSPVNQLGSSDSSVEHYHKGGTYYLVVNSECKWKVNVQG